MKNSILTGWGTGIVSLLTVAALSAPGVILAGPGCMNDQRMARGYYPHSPMGAQLRYNYGQAAPYAYFGAPQPYAGTMAVPSQQPMTAQRPVSAVVNSPATVVTVDTGAQPSGRAGVNDGNTTEVENITVRINGMRFEPSSIKVKPGTTVTWIHGSPMPHTIAGSEGGLRSGTLYNGQEYSHTFTKAGLYNYYCDYHPSMTGSVIVEEAGRDT